MKTIKSIIIILIAFIGFTSCGKDGIHAERTRNAIFPHTKDNSNLTAEYKVVPGAVLIKANNSEISTLRITTFQNENATTMDYSPLRRDGEYVVILEHEFLEGWKVASIVVTDRANRVAIITLSNPFGEEITVSTEEGGKGKTLPPYPFN